MSKTRYISIDRRPSGELYPVVCIWKEKPVRYAEGGGVVWLNKGRKDTSISMGVEECYERYGVTPDRDDQLIRMGPRPMLN